MQALRRDFADVKRPLENIRKLSDEVENIANLDQPEEALVQQVEIKQPDMISHLMDRLPTSLTSVGPLLTTLILVLVGFTTFPGELKALITPLLFLGLTAAEGQIITPLIIGQRLELSPVAVFLFLVFWGWIWGPVGMLLAIPILIGIKIILEKTPGKSAIGSLLSR